MTQEPGRRTRVRVGEDDPSHQEALAIALGQEGFAVSIAGQRRFSTSHADIGILGCDEVRRMGCGDDPSEPEEPALPDRL